MPWSSVWFEVAIGGRPRECLLGSTCPLPAQGTGLSPALRIPLLEAYPNYCPYETLLAHLFSLTLDEARRQLREIRKIVLRSVRRAIGSLATGLRAFGLRVRSVRDTIPKETA